MKIFVLIFFSLSTWIASAQSDGGFDIVGTYYEGDKAHYRITRENSDYFISYTNRSPLQLLKLSNTTHDKSGKYQYGFSETAENTIATFTDLAFERIGARTAMHVKVVNRGMGYEKTYFKKDINQKKENQGNSKVDITSNAGCSKLRPTAGKHPETAKYETTVSGEFGNEYIVADWNQLKKLENVAVWAKCLGLENGDSFLITRNGKKVHSGKRHYFCRYAPEGLPRGFLAHDSHASLLYLGSWFNLSHPVLAFHNLNSPARNGPRMQGTFGAADRDINKTTPLYERLVTSSIVSQGRFYDPFNFLQVKPIFGLIASTKEVVFSLRGINNVRSDYREFMVAISGADAKYVKVQIGRSGEVKTYTDKTSIKIPDNSPVAAFSGVMRPSSDMAVMSEGFNLGFESWRGEIFINIGLEKIPEDHFFVSLIAVEPGNILKDLTEAAFKPAIQIMTIFGEANDPRKAFSTYQVSPKEAVQSSIDIPLIDAGLTTPKRQNLYNAFMDYWEHHRPANLEHFKINSPDASLFGFGDMNGDGTEDGIVYWMAQAIGGTLHHGGLAVFLNDGRDNFQFTDLIGPKDYVSNLVIKNRTVHGHEDQYRPSDPRCCPSIKTAFEIRLENGKLTEKKVPRR